MLKSCNDLARFSMLAQNEAGHGTLQFVQVLKLILSAMKKFIFRSQKINVFRVLKTIKLFLVAKELGLLGMLKQI